MFPTSPFDDTKYIVTQKDRDELMVRALMTDDISILDAALEACNLSVINSQNQDSTE